MEKLAFCTAALYVVAVVQFVACIAFTASRYGPPPYDPLTVTISDLQAVSCGIFDGSYVCSPLHTLANSSVIVFGLLMVVGSLSLRPLLPGGRQKDLAVGFLIVAGVGAFANGFTPEDVTFTGDLVTAIIAFLGANFALIQIGRTLSTDPKWRSYHFFCKALGTIGIAALTLDGFGLGTLIGQGAMEWLIVAPIMVWAPTTGIRLITLHAELGTSHPGAM